MKPSVSVVFASFIALISAIVLVVFIRLPVSSLWRGYNILYVPVELEEQVVLQALEAVGIADAVSLSKQQQPVYSTFAPVQSIVSTQHSYLRQRENYFFDRSQQMQLFYVPSESMEQAQTVVDFLQSLPGGMNAGLEGKTTYPWMVPLVVFLVFLILVVLSRAKGFMLTVGFFPLLFSICIPSYSGAGGATLLLYCFFLCSTFWKRKDMFKAIKKSALILLFGCASVPVAFMGSWKEGLLFLVTIVASLSLCFVLVNWEPKKSKGFMPVPIRSARLVSVVSSVASFTLFIPAVAATILSISLLFFGYFPSDTSINGLFLPAPARYTDTISFDSVSFQDNGQQAYLEEELPSLVHYVDWVWDTLTYSYRSLHELQVFELVSAGETLLLPSYRVNQEGIIQEEYTPVYSLDDAFISSVMEGIQDEAFQIEAVLKKQNCFTSVVYRRMGDFLAGGSQGQVFIFLSLFTTIVISLIAGIFIWRIQK